MKRNQIKAHHPKSLILAPRQLKAALRKSAERAQRLADAFGEVVPTVKNASSKTKGRLPSKR